MLTFACSVLLSLREDRIKRERDRQEQLGIRVPTDFPYEMRLPAARTEEFFEETPRDFRERMVGYIVGDLIQDIVEEELRKQHEASEEAEEAEDSE